MDKQNSIIIHNANVWISSEKRQYKCFIITAQLRINRNEIESICGMGWMECFENPPTGGDASLLLNFQFDALGAKGLLCGTEFNEYPPFDDEPEAFTLSSGILGAFLCALALVVLAVAVPALAPLALGAAVAITAGALLASADANGGALPSGGTLIRSAMITGGQAADKINSMIPESVKNIAQAIGKKAIFNSLDSLSYGLQIFSANVEGLQATYDFGKKTFENVVETGKDAIDYGKNAWENLVETGQDAFDYGKKALENVAETGQDLFDLGKKVIIGKEDAGEAAIELGEKALENLAQTGKGAMDLGKKAWDNVADTVEGMVDFEKKVRDNLVETGKGAVDFVKKTVNVFEDKTKAAIEFKTNIVGNAIEGVKDIFD